MNKHQRSQRVRMVPRRRGIATGLALGLAATLFGGTVAPAVAHGDTPNTEVGAPNAPATVSEEAGLNEGSEIEVEWKRSTAKQDDSVSPGASAEDVGEASSAAGSGNNAQLETATGGGSATPFYVPTPPPGTAIISVKVGGDRLPNGTVKPLAGVRLALHDAGTGTGGGGTAGGWEIPNQGTAGVRYNSSWSWTTCTSDADGDCNFLIPVRTGSIPSSTGVPPNTRFWVVQESSPAGWYSNPSLRIGGNGASPEKTWQYRFRTDVSLQAGTTYYSTTPMPWNTTAADPDRYFMRNRLTNNLEDWWASNVGRTTGVWNQSRNNPDMIGGCPVDIALVADTSGSLGASGIASLKGAMSAFVDAFRGTNARMAAFSFSNASPGAKASNHASLIPVTTASEAASFKSQYQGWDAGGGTNWSAGFAAVANAAPHYDVAVLLTDGNPTLISDNYETGSAVNAFQDVDGGVFSANQLKAQGTRVIGLGVGPEMTASSELNLRAVSGPAKNTDYFRANTFDEATKVLVEIAKQRCTGSIGVQKLIVPENGTIANATPAPAGWKFGAESFTSGAATNPTSQTTIAGGEGKVDFGLTFLPGMADARVLVHEEQQPGYNIVQVGGKNAQCVNQNTNTPVEVTNSGTAAKPSFVITAPQNERIECKIYNRAPTPGKITVAKTSDPVSKTEVSAGQEVKYTLTFKNEGGRPAAVAYDDVLTDVLDDAALVSGPSPQAPLGAVFDNSSHRIKVTGTLAPGDTRTVTYTVKVHDPLPANANGHLGNFVVKAGEQPPTECDPQDPLCTEHPVIGNLSWNKVDSAQPSHLLGGSQWKLTPYGKDGKLIPSKAIVVEDCVASNASNCTGPDKDPAEGKFLLEGLAVGKYSLEETKAPPGYKLLDAPIEVTINTNYSLGDIKNTQASVPQLPLTGGMGTSAMLLGAGGLGALVALALIAQRRRMNKRTG